MISYLEQLSKLGWGTVIMVLLLLILALPAVGESISKFVSFFGIETKWSTKSKKNDDALARIENEVAELKSIMMEHIEESKREKEDEKTARVATFRSTLYRIHKESVKQGYIDKEGLTTFLEAGKIYESAGGNDIYHQKLYPEVMALPIKE